MFISRCVIAEQIIKKSENTNEVILIRREEAASNEQKKIMIKGQTTIYKTPENKRSGNTNPTKNGGVLRCSGGVGSSCSSNSIRRVSLVTNPVISHE